MMTSPRLMPIHSTMVGWRPFALRRSVQFVEQFVGVARPWPLSATPRSTQRNAIDDLGSRLCGVDHRQDTIVVILVIAFVA